jgi:alpha,alpha-trehalase
MGFREEARRVAREFTSTIDAGFARDSTIVEKYNVVAGNSNVQVSTGYKVNQVGFGWSNAVYLKMKQILAVEGQTH